MKMTMPAQAPASFSLAIWLVLLSKSSSVQAISCSSSGSQPLLNDMAVNAFANCTTIIGDVVIGYENCDQACQVEHLDAFAQVESVVGSLSVQCCNRLAEMDAFNALVELSGTIKVHYNLALQTISGFRMLQRAGNVEISQNSRLESLLGWASLDTVDGFLALDRNPALADISGLSSVASIGGNQLLGGHALVLLYNIALVDLSGLRNVATVSGGTVRIEGNRNLCYAGYPLWNYGAYPERYSSGDMGIDWRSKLSAVPEWQYTWGTTGVPTLVIQDNGNQTTCASASCSSSCAAGAGCLGSNDASLCGSCYTTSSVDSCTVIDPPTIADEQCSTSSGILIALCVCIGIIVLIILAGLGYLAWKYREKICDLCSSTGSFDIDVPTDQNLMNSPSDYSPNFKSNRRHRGGIIAEPSFSGPHTGKKKNVKELDVTGTVGPVIYRKHSSLESLDNLEETEAAHVTGSTSRVEVVVAPTESAISHPQIPITKNTPKNDAFVLENPAMSHKEADDEDDEWEEMDAIGIDSSLRIPSDHVYLKKEVGQGVFGKVFEARADGILGKKGASTVMVRQLHRNASEEEIDVFLQTAAAMSSLNHKNVLSLLGVCMDGPSVMVILEHCSGGNLKSFLILHRHEAQQMRDSGTLLKMILDMANGVHYLNTMEIAHNDLAARNCLVSNSNTVKVGDYGISRTVFKEDYYSRDPNGMSWPVRWMAPEMIVDRGDGILDSKEASRPSNVWSFGITLWEVCSFARQPYPNMSNEEVIDLLKYSRSCNLKNPIASSELHSSLYSIMKKCWKPEKDRPTMEEVLLQLQRIKEKFKPKDNNDIGTLSRRPKRPAPKKPPEKKKQPPPNQDVGQSESTEPVMRSSRSKSSSPQPPDSDPDRTNPLFGSVVTSDEDDWREAEELMGDPLARENIHKELEMNPPKGEKVRKHVPSNTSATDLPPTPPPSMTYSPFSPSANNLPPPVLPPPIDNEDEEEDDFFLEPPDDVLLPPPSDALLAPPTDAMPPPPAPIDDPLEEDDMESWDEENLHAAAGTSDVFGTRATFVPPPQRFSQVEDDEEDVIPPHDIPKQKYTFVEPPGFADNDDDGWEEFDPDETQLTELSYPPYPAEGDEDIPSPILNEKEARLIW